MASRVINVSEEESLNAAIIVYCFLAITGALGVNCLALIFTKCKNILLPSSVWWFLFGMILTSITIGVGLQKDTGQYSEDNINTQFVYGLFEYIIHFSPQAIYKILLPPLLMEGAFNTDTYYFGRYFWGSVFRAYIGVVFNAGLICPVFYGLWAAVWPEFLPGWVEILLISAIVSSTDPVSVISVLKRVGCPEHLVILFEGESLFNDGTSVILTQIVAAIIIKDYSSAQYAEKVFYLLLGSPAFGILCGTVVLVVASMLHGYNSLCSVFIITCSYLSFLLAESISVSGPLVTVILALFLNRFGWRAWDIVQHKSIEESLGVVAIISEIFIFTISGSVSLYSIILPFINITNDMVGSEYFRTDLEKYWDGASDDEHTELWMPIILGLLLFITMAVVRLIGLLLLTPIENLWSHRKIEVKEQIVLWFGGLRGAIVLALALSPLDADIKMKGLYTVIICMAVAFNLVLQGYFFKLFYDCINPYAATDADYRRLDSTRDVDQTFMKDIISDLMSHGVIPDKSGELNNKNKNNLEQRKTDPLKLMEVNTLTYEKIEALLRQRQQEGTNNVNDTQNPLLSNAYNEDGTPNISFILQSAAQIRLGIGIRSAVRKYERELEHYGLNIKDLLQFIIDECCARFDLLRFAPNAALDMPEIPSCSRLVRMWVDKVNKSYMKLQIKAELGESSYSSSEDLVDKFAKCDREVNKETEIDNFIQSCQEIQSYSQIIETKSISNNHFYQPQLWDDDSVDLSRRNDLALYITQAARHLIMHYLNEQIIDYHTFHVLIKGCDHSLSEIEEGNYLYDQWAALKRNLHVRQDKVIPWSVMWYKKHPNRLNRSIAYRNCITDLSAILVFIDIYENLLLVLSMQYEHEILKDTEFCKLFAKAFREAETYINILIYVYDDIFHIAFFVVFSKFIKKRKIDYIQARLEAGVVDDSSANYILARLKESEYRLSRYKDFRRPLSEIKYPGERGPPPESMAESVSRCTSLPDIGNHSALDEALTNRSNLDMRASNPLKNVPEGVGYGNDSSSSSEYYDSCSSSTDTKTDKKKND